MYKIYSYINDKWVEMINFENLSKAKIFYEKYKKEWPYKTFKLVKEEIILSCNMGGQI